LAGNGGDFLLEYFLDICAIHPFGFDSLGLDALDALGLDVLDALGLDALLGFTELGFPPNII
jgi:hypothetical protein